MAIPKVSIYAKKAEILKAKNFGIKSGLFITSRAWPISIKFK